jgi:hypothetical protein
MTLVNINRNRKGGDAYGKVPKRIAIALAPPLKVRGARGVMKGFAKGNKTMPGPGKNVVLNVVRGFSLAREHKMGSLI